MMMMMITMGGHNKEEKQNRFAQKETLRSRVCGVNPDGGKSLRLEGWARATQAFENWGVDKIGREAESGAPLGVGAGQISAEDLPLHIHNETEHVEAFCVMRFTNQRPSSSSSSSCSIGSLV